MPGQVEKELCFPVQIARKKPVRKTRKPIIAISGPVKMGGGFKKLGKTRWPQREFPGWSWHILNRCWRPTFPKVLHRLKLQAFRGGRELKPAKSKYKTFLQIPKTFESFQKKKRAVLAAQILQKMTEFSFPKNRENWVLPESYLRKRDFTAESLSGIEKVVLGSAAVFVNALNIFEE